MEKDNIKELGYYLDILKAFEDVLDQVEGNEDDIWYVIAVLSEVRFKYLINIVSDELLLSYEYAMDIIRENINKGFDDITDDRAKVLLSAMENLLSFSVCEQYKMIQDMPEELDIDDESTLSVFYKYNGIYAFAENNVVEQAALIALTWQRFDNKKVLQFTTQRDERVRHSHQILDGFKATKDNFPSELIPPIDYNCRCFIVDSGDKDFDDDFEEIDKYVSQYKNDVFAESLATYGAIFSHKHSYFNNIEEGDEEYLLAIQEAVLEKILTKDTEYGYL